MQAEGKYNKLSFSEVEYKTLSHTHTVGWGSPHDVMTKIPDVSESELQIGYYIHFQTNTVGKGMNTLIPRAISQIVSLLFFYKDEFGIKK